MLKTKHQRIRELKKLIEEKATLINMMVGSLYPSILAEEIEEHRNEIERLQIGLRL